MSAQYFGGRKILEVTLEDLLNTALSGRVICRWFNQHYLQRMFATGQELIRINAVESVEDVTQFDILPETLVE
jgi:uncharacterized protein YodC (DUF2158 family)